VVVEMFALRARVLGVAANVVLSSFSNGSGSIACCPLPEAETTVDLGWGRSTDHQVPIATNDSTDAATFFMIL
jgi:hypothetical protein